MTTAEHAQSARTETCPTPDELKQYLAGWSDDAQAERVETHLQNCQICEAAIQHIESKPDTLLQSLQSTVAPPVARSVPDRDSAAPNSEADSPQANDPPINAALAKARQLMDSPIETAADKAKAAWQPAQRELGMYELIKPLGRGGMGAVYLATHKQLKKQVAIKLLPMMSSEDSDVRARFDREIRVVGKLNHPSIVAATDAGEIDGTQFLVMEYVPGLDLSRLARLLGKLPVADACELMRQVALGLSCAHAEGVVHRDVKPSNLMLDESGRIRILDFGLAQLSVWDEASVDLTTVGQLMGTLDYMAPEQAEFSGSVDYRADLYAMGATLFRLLCGRPPLAAAPNQSPLEKLRMLANHQSPKLDTLCPAAPADLVKLVASLLSRSPQDRPASAAHVAEQLAPFAEGSKLVDLLQQAKEKAATSPELLRKTAFADLPGIRSLAPVSPVSLPAPTGNGRSKIVRRLLLAASLPLLIIAGILIRLELNKGQLVIESDVADVTVKLLKDGKPVDGIQVSHGTTSTRLQADNYEITIDGPSDGLVIDNDKFTLKNGETVVARITKESDRPSPGVSESSAVQLVDGVDVRAAASSLREYSVTLDDAALQWLDTARLPNSDEVIADVVAFKEDVRRLQRLQGRESNPGELRSTLDRSFESWQAVYRHLDQCRTVERGKLSTTAGKIRLVLTRLNDLIPKADSNESVSNAPLYDGKPLEHWLAMLSREKSAAGLKSAFDACTALASPETSGQITTTVLGVLPKLDGETILPSDSPGQAFRLDYRAAMLLQKLNPGAAFCELWVREFDAADEAWRKRLWDYFIYGRPDSPEPLEPFIVWAEDRLSKPRTSDHAVDLDAVKEADLLRNFTAIKSPVANPNLIQRIIKILKSSPRLGATWWLSQPLAYPSGNGSPDENTWAPPIKDEITRVAVDAIENDDTSPSLVAQACMILSRGADLTPEQRERVLTSVSRRLSQLCAAPDSWTDMVQINDSFSNVGSVIRMDSPLGAVRIEMAVRASMVRDIPVTESSLLLEMLTLVVKLDGTASVQPQLDLIMKETQETLARIYPQREHAPESMRNMLESIRRSGRRSPFVVNLVWPALTASDASPQGGAPSIAGTQGSIQLLWGDHQPSKRDWLEYLILNHPAMKDTVAGAIEKLK